MLFYYVPLQTYETCKIAAHRHRANRKSTSRRSNGYYYGCRSFGRIEDCGPPGPAAGCLTAKAPLPAAGYPFQCPGNVFGSAIVASMEHNTAIRHHWRRCASLLILKPLCLPGRQISANLFAPPPDGPSAEIRPQGQG